MSSILKQIFAGLAVQKQVAGPTQPNPNLNASLDTLNKSIQRMTDSLIQEPFVALNLNVATSVNQAANTVIGQGVPVPVGYKLVLQDDNFVSVTSGGSVSLVIMDYNGKNIVNTITSNISSSASGFGGTVIEQTNCAAVIVNTQGAGTVTSYLSGYLKKMVNYQ